MRKLRSRKGLTTVEWSLLVILIIISVAAVKSIPLRKLENQRLSQETKNLDSIDQIQSDVLLKIQNSKNNEPDRYLRASSETLEKAGFTEIRATPYVGPDNKLYLFFFSPDDLTSEFYPLETVTQFFGPIQIPKNLKQKIIQLSR